MRRSGSYGASLNRGRDGKEPQPPWPEGKRCGAGCSCVLIVVILRWIAGSDLYEQFHTLDVVGAEAHAAASLSMCAGLGDIRLRRDGTAASLPREVPGVADGVTRRSPPQALSLGPFRQSAQPWVSSDVWAELGDW